MRLNLFFNVQIILIFVLQIIVPYQSFNLHPLTIQSNPTQTNFLFMLTLKFGYPVTVRCLRSLDCRLIAKELTSYNKKSVSNPPKPFSNFKRIKAILLKTGFHLSVVLALLPVHKSCRCRAWFPCATSCAALTCQTAQKCDCTGHKCGEVCHRHRRRSLHRPPLVICASRPCAWPGDRRLKILGRTQGTQTLPRCPSAVLAYRHAHPDQQQGFHQRCLYLHGCGVLNGSALYHGYFVSFLKDFQVILWWVVRMLLLLDYAQRDRGVSLELRMRPQIPVSPVCQASFGMARGSVYPCQAFAICRPILGCWDQRLEHV